MNKTDFGESDDEADENEDEMDTGKRPKRRYCVGLRDFVESFADRPTVHYIGTVGYSFFLFLFPCCCIRL